MNNLRLCKQSLPARVLPGLALKRMAPLYWRAGPVHTSANIGSAGWGCSELFTKLLAMTATARRYSWQSAGQLAKLGAVVWSAWRFMNNVAMHGSNKALQPARFMGTCSVPFGPALRRMKMAAAAMLRMRCWAGKLVS